MKIFFLLLLFIFATTNIFAKDIGLTTSVSSVGMSMDYREYADITGELLDSEESDYWDITGVEMEVGYLFNKSTTSSSQIKVNLLILGGTTVYKGSYIESGEPYGSVVSSTENVIIDTDLSYIQIYALKNNFELRYGIGLAYREWERALSDSQIEVYSWYSLRPMIGLDVSIKEKFTLGAKIEYQYGFDTIMTISDLEFTLGGADIWEVSFPASYAINPKAHLLFEAIFQKQTIVRSNVVSGFYEPRSTAYNNYLKFGFEYRF